MKRRYRAHPHKGLDHFHSATANADTQSVVLFCKITSDEFHPPVNQLHIGSPAISSKIHLKL